MDTNILPYGKISSAKKLGQAVRAKRKADGLTQVKAAALCGVGIRFISDLENGKSTIELGKALSVLVGLGLTVDVRPKGTLNRNKVNQHKSKVSKKVYLTNINNLSDNYTKALAKLADSYKGSLNFSTKAFDDFVKHRDDYYSLGITMDKYNDIAKSYKHILDLNSSSLSGVSDVRATIDKLRIENKIPDNVLNKIKASVSLNSEALMTIKNLKSTIGSLNLNTKVINNLQDNYKINIKLSKDTVNKLSDLKTKFNSIDMTNDK